MSSLEPPATQSYDPPVSHALADFMSQGWDRRLIKPARMTVADATAARRASLTSCIPGRRLIVPAGSPPRRAGDQKYRFRAESDHVWLTGWAEPNAVLIVDSSLPEGALLFRLDGERRDTDEFWRSRTRGEFWNGRRLPHLVVEYMTGIPCRDLDELPDHLGADAVVLRGVDGYVDSRVPASPRDAELARSLSDLRLVKDEYEVEQLTEAVQITQRGFDDVITDWAQVRQHGERWIEGTFERRARLEGNGVGYASIAAAGEHATSLHWIDNSGMVADGQLVLMDMGVEANSLYTADITRTVPVSGTFTPAQRAVYEIVERAQTQAMAAVRPGAAFRAFHHAATEVLAQGLADLGLLPCSVDEALDPSSQVYRRWTLCGTGHMLGLDVHDCGNATFDRYPEGQLEVGHVLTVEPGLYFQPDDLLVPPDLRGVGIRIEDDLVVTVDGSVNLSADLPRTVPDIEAWFA
jgi:Xaa-Pro aminopeptidase